MDRAAGLNLRCAKIVWLDFCFLVRIRLYGAAGLQVSCMGWYHLAAAEQEKGPVRGGFPPGAPDAGPLCTAGDGCGKIAAGEEDRAFRGPLQVFPGA